MKLKLPRIRLPSRAGVEDLVRETCLVAGFFMLARGLWMIFPPAAWLVCGLLLLWVGFPPKKPGGGGD